MTADAAPAAGDPAVEGPALEVRGLSASYGPVEALDRVDVAAGRGQVTAVLGANGAGKSTLLRTISGLVRATAGEVRIDGVDHTGSPAEQIARAGVAHVPEGRGVITELTVEENLHLGRQLGAARRPGGRSLDDVYAMFPPLAERRRRSCDTLSGGERQMLVIGRALLCEPDVLLLDEPSLGLAPRVVAQIFGLLRELVDTAGISVLLVEQNARSALSIADVGVVLNLGRVVARDDASTLAADDGLRHAYLGF
ncbi:ABC transporter ATP-binding protein [Pseudonocardia sp. KRD291]|uniref:ABC transporter ATP-binding protein n=1 Tax=Pseudonocardia sp. KRD291 TaxID=2792007 RepID=UPI001C4A50F9|nr:ABC transporter ATP-binding protein [Pseudonocardia sp. KRD291]MBW0106050.1 ABC transporter ATP-binding protein [Pseudonocardia sp. KRD291]